MGNLVRIEKIHGCHAVSRKRNQKFHSVHDDVRQKPGKNDVEALRLRGLFPEDIDEQKRCLRKIGGKRDPKEVLVCVGCKEKAVHESSCEEWHRDVSEE